MKKSKFNDSQVLSILKQASAGLSVPDLWREHSIYSVTFYKWRAKFGGMDLSMISRLKELEAENVRLKKMYADEGLKSEILKEAIEVVLWLKRRYWTIKYPLNELVYFSVSARLVIVMNRN